jgi:hypothetical protein
MAKKSLLLSAFAGAATDSAVDMTAATKIPIRTPTMSAL